MLFHCKPMQKMFFKASNYIQRDNWVSKLNSRLSFCFQAPVRLVNETTRLHKGKPIGQRDWSRKQNNKFYQKSCLQKFLFFWRLKKVVFFNFCAFKLIIKTVYQENIPFVNTMHMYVFIKGIIRKTNCYWHMHFFFDLY